MDDHIVATLKVLVIGDSGTGKSRYVTMSMTSAEPFPAASSAYKHDAHLHSPVQIYAIFVSLSFFRLVNLPRSFLPGL